MNRNLPGEKSDDAILLVVRGWPGLRGLRLLRNSAFLSDVVIAREVKHNMLWLESINFEFRNSLGFRRPGIPAAVPVGFLSGENQAPGPHRRFPIPSSSSCVKSTLVAIIYLRNHPEG
jgi:hypothetical protein